MKINKWFEKYQNGKYLILAIFIIASIYCLILYAYPIYLQTVYINFISNNPSVGLGYNIGTFGDMYGALNSFLSAVAFLGLLVTIFLQIYIHKKEIARDENLKLQEYNEKIIYLSFSLSNLLDQIKVLINALEEWKSNMINKPDSAEILNFEPLFDRSIFEELNNKIDQQHYFTAYLQFHKDSEIIQNFQSLKQIDNRYSNFIIIYDKYKEFFNSNIVHHRDYYITCISLIPDQKIRSEFKNLPTNDNGEREHFINKTLAGKVLTPEFSKVLSKLFRLDIEFKHNKYKLIEESTSLINQLENKYHNLIQFQKKISKSI
ncbi:hypothetical protein GOQ04_17070 [Emticicia sp. ODNR4P]|nr:hypothetical protein [Emticicia sp. ODNR4P]